MQNPNYNANQLLIAGTVRAIYEKDESHPAYSSPWLQVVNMRKLVGNSGGNNPNGGNQGAAERYRILLSDGENTVPSMFGSVYTSLINSGAICQNAILKINTYAFNAVNKNKGSGTGTFVLIPKDVDMASIKYCDKVFGNPVSYNPGVGQNENLNVSNQPAYHHQQQQQQQPNPYASNISATGANGTGNGNGYNSNPYGSSTTTTTMSNNPNSFHAAGSNINNNNAGNMYNAKPVASNNNGSSSAAAAANLNYSNNSIDQSNVVPIGSLSPYNSKWLIKARVTNKSDMRTWSNQKGDGKLFSVTLVDASGEIKATAFNDVAERLFNIFQLNKVYYVSKAAVKIAKKQYSNVQNDYEISFDNSSLVEPCLEDSDSIPSIKYNFVPIQSITDFEKDTNIDVIGIVKECGDLAEIVSKTTQRTSKKRDLVLVDSSSSSINVTLWGNQAVTFNMMSQNPVVAIKGARVSDYQGRSLNLSNSSSLTISPDIPESFTLRGWYDSHGASTNFYSLTGGAGIGSGSGGAAPERQEHRIMISQIQDENLGAGEKPDYFNLIATISYIKSDGVIYYTACPSPNCNKKVTEVSGQWSCEKCSKSYSHCDYRYMMSIQVIDRTGVHYLNVFDEVGRMILGKTAEEIHHLKINDTDGYDTVFKNAVHKMYNFKVRAKQEMYQNEAKIRCSVITATPIAVEKECDLMIDYLKSNGFNFEL